MEPNDINTILALGMDGLDIIAKKLDETPYSVSVRFKRYGFACKKATVSIVGKTFTEIGEKAVQYAIRDAIVYCIRTFAVFEAMREDVNKILCEQQQACEPCSFNLNFR